jgi:hypothetical protein
LLEIDRTGKDDCPIPGFFPAFRDGRDSFSSWHQTDIINCDSGTYHIERPYVDLGISIGAVLLEEMTLRRSVELAFPHAPQAR